MNKKKFLQGSITIYVSILSILSGYAMANKLHSLSEDAVKVIGNKIYHENKLFAELRYFTDKQYNVLKGVAIYYFQRDREVWIFPKEGWSVRLGGKEYFAIQDIDTIWNRYLVEHQESIEGKRTKPELDQEAILLLGGENPPKIQPSVFDVEISENGKYIYYKTPGIFFDSSHKYLVEYAR